MLTGLFFAGGILYTSIRAYKHRQQKKKKSPPSDISPEIVRRQPQKTEHADIATVEEWADCHFSLATISLGAAVAGIWIPPLGIA